MECAVPLAGLQSAEGIQSGLKTPVSFQWTPATTGHGEDIARGAVGTGNWGSGPISAAPFFKPGLTGQAGPLQTQEGRSPLAMNVK